MQTVADLTKTVMPGNPEASVTLLLRQSATTAAYTGRLAVDLDETQYEKRYGPCLHAARSGEPTEIVDARSEARWRDYVQRAVEHGSLSSLSIPLAIEDGVSVALNIYARRPHAFGEDSRGLARCRPHPPAGVPFGQGNELGVAVGVGGDGRPGEHHPDAGSEDRGRVRLAVSMSRPGQARSQTRSTRAGT